MYAYNQRYTALRVHTRDNTFAAVILDRILGIPRRKIYYTKYDLRAALDRLNR